MATQTIAQLFDLTGKAVIVTGGASGIGQAIASRMSEAGAGVMIADVNVRAATKNAEQIRSRGGKAEAVGADTGSAADCAGAVQATIKAFGRVDILVNNAGIFPFSPAMRINEDTWDSVIRVNLKGVFLFTKSAAEEMIRSGNGGKIINIASVDAIRPAGALAHYDASKGGVVSLTQSFALELARHRILVNAIAPGGVGTAGVQTAITAYKGSGMYEQTRPSNFLERLPLRRMGEPDDIAKVALFLASGASDYMTGSLVVVDGGYLVS